MPRGLSSGIKTAIAADTVRPVYLVFFDFVGDAVRTWTGEGDLSYDAQTWSGDGTLQALPSITESSIIFAESVRIELSGQPDTAVDLSDPANYQGRNVEVYIGFLDAAGSLPAANVYKVFSGTMSEISFSSDANSEAWTVTAESRLVDLQRANAALWTHEEQRSRYSADTGLAYEAKARTAVALFSERDVPAPAARPIIYGQRRVSGQVVFAATSGSSSRYLNLVIAVADHECQSIEQVYINDEAVLSGGSVAGQFVDFVDYYSKLGADAQTYIAALETEVGSAIWDSDSRLRGVCYVYLRLLSSDDLFGETFPSIEVELKGKKIYDTRKSVTVDVPNEDFDDGTLKYWEINEVPDLVGLVILINGVITTQDVGIYVDGDSGNRVFFAQRNLLSASDSVLVIKRTYSTNAALVIRDYLLADAGFGAAAGEIDETAFEVAADVCDQLVTKADGSSEPRYRISGLIDTSQPIGANLENLIRACAGVLTYAGGQFGLQAGRWVAPAVTVTVEDLLDSLPVTNSSRRSWSNGAKGLYTNALNNWAQENYPNYSNAAAVSADGTKRVLIYDLPHTTSASAAQRIAKIAVNETRRSTQLSLLCRLDFFELLPGDIVNVTLDRLGYTNKTFRVERLTLEARGLQIGVRLDLREMSSTHYDWDESTEELQLITFGEPADVLVNWVNAKLASPSGSPGSQSFSSDFNVTVSHNESGVSCYYTLDGSEPTESSSSVADGGTILIEHNNEDVTLKLKTFQDVGDLESDVVTYNYTATLVAPTPVGELYTEADGLGVLLYLRWASVDETENGETVTLMAKDTGASDSGEQNYSVVNNEMLLYTAGTGGGGTFREDSGFFFSDDNDDYLGRTQANGHLNKTISFPDQEAQPLLGRINNNLGIRLWFFTGTSNGVGENNVKIRSRKRARSSGSTYGAWGAWSEDNVTKSGHDNFTANDTFQDMDLPLEDANWVYQYEVYAFGGMWPDSIIASFEGLE